MNYSLNYANTSMLESSFISGVDNNISNDSVIFEYDLKISKLKERKNSISRYMSISSNSIKPSNVNYIENNVKKINYKNIRISAQRCT